MTNFLRGRCISAIELDAHGNAWLEAQRPTVGRTLTTVDGLEVPEIVEFGPTEIFVITPAAMAATE